MVLSLFVWGVLALPSRFEGRRERRTTLRMRIIATAIESYAVDHEAYPAQRRPGPVAGIAPALAPTHVRKLPERDAWDQPFIYWSTESVATRGNLSFPHPDWFVLLSAGADGRPEVSLDGDTLLALYPWGFEIVEDLSCRALGDDLIYTPGNRCPPRPELHPPSASCPKATREEVAVVHLRDLASAMECVWEERKEYRPTGEEMVHLDREWFRYLRKRYGWSLPSPLLDPWARPYRYWSDGEVILLACSGRDRVTAAGREGYLAARQSGVQEGPLTRMADDILYFATAPSPDGGPPDAVWHSNPQVRCDPGQSMSGCPCQEWVYTGFVEWPEGAYP